MCYQGWRELSSGLQLEPPFFSFYPISVYILENEGSILSSYPSCSTGCTDNPHWIIYQGASFSLMCSQIYDCLLAVVLLRLRVQGWLNHDSQVLIQKWTLNVKSVCEFEMFTGICDRSMWWCVDLTHLIYSRGLFQVFLTWYVNKCNHKQQTMGVVFVLMLRK